MNDRDRDRVKNLLTEAVTLLCKSSLTFDEEVAVEGLIGITLDKKDIILVSIRETLQQTLRKSNNIYSEDDSSSSAKRRRRRSSSSTSSSCDTERSEQHSPFVNFYQENNNNQQMDNNNGDAINMVKKDLVKRQSTKTGNGTTSDGDAPPMDLVIKKEVRNEEDDDCTVVTENDESNHSQNYPVVDWPGASSLDVSDSILPGTSYHSTIAYFLQATKQATGSLGTGGPVFPNTDMNPAAQNLQQAPAGVPGQPDNEEARSSGPSPARKWYRCAFCGVGYNWKQSYQRHLLLKHLGQGYMCPLCSRRFARKDHLQRHYYNCRRRYGVAEPDDPAYLASLAQAGVSNTPQSPGIEMSPHRGRGRPRGSRNKTNFLANHALSLLASSLPAGVPGPAAPGLSAPDLPLDGVDGDKPDTAVPTPAPPDKAQVTDMNLASEQPDNDRAVLLPLYRAAQNISQVAMTPEVASTAPGPESG